MKALVWILMMLVSVGVVSAMNCTMYSGDYKPFESLDYICEDVSADSCYTMIYYETANGGLINARPHVEFGEGFLKPIVRLFTTPIVVVSGFDTVHNASIVEFSTKGLKPEYLYYFQVRCGDDVYEFNSSLLWEEPTSLVRGGLWVWSNAYLIFVLILLVIAVIILIIWLWNKVRYGK